MRRDSLEIDAKMGFIRQEASRGESGGAGSESGLCMTKAVSIVYEGGELNTPVNGHWEGMRECQQDRKCLVASADKLQ